MASKEYRDNLKITDPEKHQKIYGHGATSKYRDRLKLENPEKYRSMHNKSVKLWKKNHPDKNAHIKKVGKLKSKYGLTLDQYNTLLENQNNSCKVCKDLFTNEKLTHIDHCHKTGKVRGILCLNCNLSLGYAKENIERLQGLIDYVKSNG